MSFAVFLFLLGLALGQGSSRLFPAIDSHLKSTNILDHAAYVDHLDDSCWYLDNIPFIDVPDKHIQDVYYYRASVIKRHLKFGHEGHGWLFTEFTHPVAWASKLQTIPDSVGHHVMEARWLRNPNYVKDLIQLYTRGGVEQLSGISYTHFLHDAIYEHAQVTADKEFLAAQLDGMIEIYDLWNVTVDNDTGLYHRIPLSDAQEFSLPGYVVGGPNGGPVETWNSTENDHDLIWLGPETYRPNFNAYMVAGARAISGVARLAGNNGAAQQWAMRANTIEEHMTSQLWDGDLEFWIDVIEGTDFRVEGRELIGYFPYRFDIGTNSTFVAGLEAGLTPSEFITEFGPTTLEQTSPYYTAFKNLTYCCIWQGQSWPFSTSVYLNTLAKLARSNSSDVVSKDFFFQALLNYTLTNYKDDMAYTAESQHPTIDAWSGDSTNHSEHYFHSTYLNNIFADLIGILPTFDDALLLSPLVPADWQYFAVENLPYHGTLLSIFWDATGTHYNPSNTTSGLSVYSNGTLIHHQYSLSSVNISLPHDSAAAIAQLASQPRYENILANPNAPWGFPRVTADYDFSLNGDIFPYEAWKMNDGLLWYDQTPDNYWTNNQSHVPYSTITVQLPRARNFSSVSFAFLDTSGKGEYEVGGVLKCPQAVRITTNNSTLLAERNPWTSCQGNALNTVVFDAAGAGSSSAGTLAGYGNASAAATEGTIVETHNLQITVFNQLGYAVAISEIQVWVPANTGPRYEAEDGLMGTFVGGFEGRNFGLNASIEDGGVRLYEGGWTEVAGVKSVIGAGNCTLEIIGQGEGTVDVMLNYLGRNNVTMAWTGNETYSQFVDVVWQEGDNYVTIEQVEGTPWIDAFIVQNSTGKVISS